MSNPKPRKANVPEVDAWLKENEPGFRNIGPLVSKQLKPSKNMEMEPWLVPYNSENGAFYKIEGKEYYVVKNRQSMEIWYCDSKLVDKDNNQKEEAGGLF